MTYIICKWVNDQWYCWSGRRWVKEYPDAEIFTNYNKAIRQAVKLPDAEVWENYGMADEKKVYPVERLASSYDYRGAYIKKTATDLVDLKDIAEDWYKSQQELAAQKEAIAQEFNRKWYEANKTLKEGVQKLSNEIYIAIIKYFGQINMKIIKSSNTDGLIEVFIGDQQPWSKVSVHLALTFEHRQYKGWRLRNEDSRNDIEGELSPNNTVGELIKIIKKAYSDGFWSRVA